MAFNLDKNEGAKPSTKFDLSKSNAPTATDTHVQKRKSKSWMFLIPVLLVAGIAVWYLSSNRNVNTENGTTATATASAGSTTANFADTQTTIQDVSSESLTTAETTNVDNASAAPNDNADGLSVVTASSFNKKVPATFPKGSNELSSLDGSLVKDIIVFLEKNPDAVVTVNGYASSEGELYFNQQISQSRADAFKNYLVSKGIAAARVIATGKGINNPVSSNDTEAGRIKNRRVEILLQ